MSAAEPAASTAAAVGAVSPQPVSRADRPGAGSATGSARKSAAKVDTGGEDGDPQQAEHLHGPVVQHQVLRCATLTAVEQEGIPQQRERERNDGELVPDRG